MMTSTQIRQSFLDFFKSKQHTIVPSSSLLPDSPNLLFTNAGMNQFVPIFLGQTKCPYTPGRAADTQKCIRAGGKHNDLDDVGLDTYHHTFFEMLGNWSFGDYFKKEAIDWAWELVVGIWKFPPQRLYATVYNPDKSKSDPSDFDQDAWNFWAEKFRAVGLDPAVHIVNGSKKDNFWMMGETGPCGPCSELHVDLTPTGDTKGSLVNKGDARCIEIWNLVFIQFNANPDGTFSPLPAKHVDTGMGFERVTSIIQGTKGFTDFANARISNYETDIFRPVFDAIEKLSGKKYGSTLPPADLSTINSQQSTDVAFRVIGDHIRTLSFAIADGIQPGNTDRNYVLRRILRRAVRYGRTLGFHEPFFYKLVDVLADTMGDVFPEIRAKRNHVEEVIQREEEAFNKTLDKGLEVFGGSVARQMIPLLSKLFPRSMSDMEQNMALNTLMLIRDNAEKLISSAGRLPNRSLSGEELRAILVQAGVPINFLPDTSTTFSREEIEQLKRISGADAFQLYDTYGFPLDLTELMARERGLNVDTAGFEKLMEEQRARARAAQKKEVISLSQIETTAATKFVGFDMPVTMAKVVEIVQVKDKTAVVFDTTPLYAEMGGQVGDTGAFRDPKVVDSTVWKIVGTQKSGNTWLHLVEENAAGKPLPQMGSTVSISVDGLRRAAIERHHTVTHLLHWALRLVLGKEISQKGSFVGPDKLTFDFNSQPIPQQVLADIEKMVNDHVLLNHGVSWSEVPHNEVKGREDVMQFFGDKYGDTVRVVQIGGHAGKLDGFSMELCGGTHTRATGEIGLFRIVGENAIAAGVRRIEAVAGLEAYGLANDQLRLLRSIAGQLNAPVTDLEKKVEALLAHQKELEKQLKSANQREAANNAKTLLAKAETVNGTPAIIANIAGADGDTLQIIADALKSQFKGVVVLGGAANGSVSLIAAVTPDFIAKFQAGKIIQQIAPIVGGKGGGKPDNARGGGKDASKLDEALAQAKASLG